MELPFLFNTTSSGTGYLEDAIAHWKYDFNLQQQIPHFSDRMNSQNLEDQADPILNFSSEEAYSLADTNAEGEEQEAIHSSEESPPLHKAAMSESSYCMPSSFTSTLFLQELTEKKIAYPFDVVKPGGVDGEVTLKEINHRILTRPKKPVQHPVGKYATYPCVSPASGFGISGKAVVALTKVHTQGGGTITVIRTKD